MDPIPSRPRFVIGGNLEHVSVPALNVMLHCARESFDAATLRYLSRELGRLADEKEGGK